MDRNNTRRKGTALVAAAGLAAGVVGVIGMTPAGATPQTVAMECSPTTLAPAGTPNIPFIVTLDGSSPATAFPTGASVTVSNVSGAITIPGQVVGGYVAQAGATAVGIGGGQVSILATNTSQGSQLNTTLANISGAPVAITGYNATGGPGGTPIADDIVIPFAGPVAYPNWTTSGTNGGTVTFTPVASGSGFVTTFVNGLIPALGAGTLNNGTGAPTTNGGDCFTLSPAGGPIASTSLVDPAPSFTAPVGTQTVSNAATAAIQVTATDSSPTSVLGNTWAVNTQASNGTVTLASAGASGSTSTSVFNYTANAGYIGTDSFVVQVGDGVSTSTYTINLNVVGGDAGSQGVNQDIAGGYLDVDACGFGPDNNTSTDTQFTDQNCQFSMTAITLDGTNKQSTGSFNDLTVSDARGTPVPWSLTAQLLGPLQNATAYPGANDEIAAANLVMGTPTCTTLQGLNPNPLAGSGGSLDTVRSVCSASAGQNGGQFLADASVTLSIPASTYAGSYHGVISFIVA